MKLTWRTLLHIHAYLGLLCAPYLLIFSLSSLDFNHHFISEKPLGSPHTWETELSIPPHDDLEAVSQAVMDSLGIFGWFLPWDSYRDSSQIYLEVSQPGKKYAITLHENGTTKVEAFPESGANVMKLLHFLGESIPHAPWWVNTWQHYQSLTVYALLFWVLSGIILWMRKKKTPKLESVFLWGGALISILFIVWLWRIG